MNSRCRTKALAVATLLVFASFAAEANPFTYGSPHTDLAYTYQTDNGQQDGEIAAFSAGTSFGTRTGVVTFDPLNHRLQVQMALDQTG